MKRPSKALVAKWDEKLKKAGFVEIENRENGLLNVWADHYWRARYTPESFEERRRYFELATDWLNTGTFETGRHKTAWKWHADGLSYRDIGLKMGITKDVVQPLIQRCQREAGLRAIDD